MEDGNSGRSNKGPGQPGIIGINDPMTGGVNGTPKIEFDTSQEKNVYINKNSSKKFDKSLVSVVAYIPFIQTASLWVYLNPECKFFKIAEDILDHIST